MDLASSNRPSLVRAQDLSPGQENQVEDEAWSTIFSAAIHIPPKCKPLTGDNRLLRGFVRLKEQKRQDERKALYGDSPSQPRQPAPYLEGEIITTKHTTNRDGMGSGDHPNEALALRLVKEHTTIPVPDFISSDWDRITMSFIEG
ncbi:hypothetical protein G3M48_001654 [Beauveria asiatica]|uniref:Uncharacterized protein n=1 Tax=Beauveria asiatica TaxID=1069075 RepID=A0AAW0RYQ3_9HYPO